VHRGRFPRPFTIAIVFAVSSLFQHRDIHLIFCPVNSRTMLVWMTPASPSAFPDVRDQNCSKAHTFLEESCLTVVGRRQPGCLRKMFVVAIADPHVSSRQDQVGIVDRRPPRPSGFN